MNDENSYGRQLSALEIAEGKHRDFVGGLWDEVGSLQFDFLKRQGLLPQHTFLDVGCGALRGGVRFIPYLEAGNYYGLDLNPSLIEAGRHELASAGLVDKHPHLLANDGFEFHRFGAQFDFALALSVFTHLFKNHIERCLVEMHRVLKPRGWFYASFFQAPHPVHLAEIPHQPGGIVTKSDSDPFHYSLAEMRAMGGSAGLTCELMEDWKHPRAQEMLRFGHIDAG